MLSRATRIRSTLPTMGPADQRIRNLAVGLHVRDGHVLVQEFAGTREEPPFVRAIGGGIEFGERAAEALREDLESRGPMRLSEVEAQQKEILKTVRRLADEGQIALASGGDDAFV